MKFLITILFTLACNFSVSGQDKPLANADCKTLEIQEITLKDKVLIEQLQLFLREALAKDSSFANRGYLTLNVDKSPYNTESVRVSYNINKNYYNFDHLENDDAFPSFYSYINGKIVLINTDILSDFGCVEYSLNSKRAFQKIIEPLLTKKMSDLEDETILGAKNFRPGETIQMHGGRTIYIFADKNKPPLVIPNRY